MELSDFDYHLPKELIAQSPESPRTHSRLMILKNNKIEHKKFYEIENYFSKGDVLVINETKVMKIKLIGKKESGGKVELMLMGEKNAIIKGKAKKGDKIFFEKNIFGTIEEKKENEIKINFNKPLEEVIKLVGKMPTPPYIKTEIKNDSDYQTVFANKEGSLACPTSGLHFDEELFKKIQNKGVKIAKICLHVSFDTFLPVKENEIKNHEMHGEYCQIDEEDSRTINSAKRIFVLGTTAMRALESLSSEDGKVHAEEKITKIFIYPGYKFNLNYAGLITNFHLPKSTLLMMISAFYGKEKIMKAYKIAIEKKYRFFSLGDAMFLMK